MQCIIPKYLLKVKRNEDQQGGVEERREAKMLQMVQTALQYRRDARGGA